MSKKNMLFTAAALLALAAQTAWAADERARKDVNGAPAMLGVVDTTGELRQLRTDAGGFVLVVSTKVQAIGGVVTAHQGNAGASAWPVSAAALPLPAGAATEATLGGVKTGTDRVPAQGQAAMSASLPVAIASDQSAVPISDGGGSITVDGSLAVAAGAWTTPSVSTGSCPSGSASLALPANASAKASGFCNEGDDPVRIGASGVNSTVGFIIDAHSCADLDGPSASFQGAIYCTSTTGLAQAFSALRGL